VESVRLVREQGGRHRRRRGEGGPGGGFPSPKGALLHPDQVTLVFNLALLHERQHETGAAGRLYRWILDAFPGYTDCHVRLGSAGQGPRGQRGCLAHISSALQSAPNDPQALLLRSEVECGEDGGSGVEKGKATVKRVLETQRDRARSCARAAGQLEPAHGDPRGPVLQRAQGPQARGFLPGQSAGTVPARSGRSSPATRGRGRPGWGACWGRRVLRCGRGGAVAAGAADAGGWARGAVWG